MTNLVERFSVLDGVSNIRVGGAQTYAMRVWLDRKELAARGLTLWDVAPSRVERDLAQWQPITDWLDA